MKVTFRRLAWKTGLSERGANSRGLVLCSELAVFAGAVQLSDLVVKTVCESTERGLKGLEHRFACRNLGSLILFGPLSTATN